MLQFSQIDLGAPLAPGELGAVDGARGLVVIAQSDADASARRRSADVARRLQARELSTLTLGLVAPGEAAEAADAEALARRLEQALDALPPSLGALPLGLLAADTGAAAALVVAARRPARIAALVCQSGRPEQAESVLGDVRAPTLLIVGAADAEVQDLNRQAYARLRGPKRIEIVPRASHLFLEAGALDAVVQSAGDWFGEHLAAAR